MIVFTHISETLSQLRDFVTEQLLMTQLSGGGGPRPQSQLGMSA